jgi:hypothetical protein
LHEAGGRVRNDGHVARRRPDDSTDLVIHRGDRILPRRFRLVSPDFALEADMVVDCVDDRLRHQRRASVVEMIAMSATGCVGAPLGELDARGGKVGRRHSNEVEGTKIY